MKTITAFFAFAVCGVVVVAATVPQKTVGDYYFSRPIHTNLTGTVMGKPPAYTVLRYEDIAWLREAACERAALLSRSWRGLSTSRVLMPQYGPFPLSQTNRFYRYSTAKEWQDGHMVTNITVGWNYVTNWGAGVDTKTGYASGKDIAQGLSFGSGFGGYLSTNDADWVQGSKTISGKGFDWHPPHITNVTTTVATNYPSSYWGDHGLTINRTTVVEVVTMRMTNGTVSVYSNVWQVTKPRVETTTTTNVEYWQSYNLLFSSGRVMPYTTPKPASLSFFPRYSQVEKYYDWLGGMRRVALEVNYTNSVKGTGYSWDTWDGEPEVDSWQTSTSLIYAEGYGESGYGYTVNPGSFSLSFNSGFSWNVLHTGNVYRVSKAVLYAVVNVYLEDKAKNPTEYRGGYYAKRIGEMSKEGSPSSGVYFTISVSIKGLIEEAAVAIGITPPVFDGSWGFKTFGSSVVYYVVLDFAPWASLPGW